jgi:apolipoprotein N-acyltransferase
MKSLQLIFLSLLSGLLLGCSWYFNLSFFIFVVFVPLLFIEDYFSSNKSLIKRSSLKLWALSYLSFLTWNLIVTWWVVNASFGGALMAFIANSLLMSWVFLIFHKLKLTYKSVWILIPIYLAWEHGHTLWDISWTWLTLGNVFAYHPNWIQWYELTGVSGGSLWVLCVNVFIFQLIRQKQVATFLSKPIYQLAALIMLPMLISFGILFYRTTTLTKKGKGEPCVIVQPNLDPYNDKFYIEFSEQFLNMLNQVRGKITNETRYLVLPETFMINDMNEDHLEDYEEINWFKDSLLKAFPKLNIITGGSTYKFYKTKAEASLTARLDLNSNMYYDMYNTAILLNTDGVSFYHKSKLVPGVEKMPFPLILKPLEKLAINLQGTVGSLGIQKDRTNLTCNNGIKVAPIICYESVYGDYCTGYARNGANLVAIVTNDGWWGNTPGYKQHLNYARLRAIELRKQIVRSANTGVSAFINEFGDIQQATEYEQKAVMTVNTKSNDISTFFSKMGDLISYASVLFSVCLIVFGVYLKFKK